MVTRARSWQQARTESCLDHDIREIWDAQTLDCSLWCLDERRMDLEALVESSCTPTRPSCRRP